MRIIAGKYKGRKLLDSSKLKELRPTTDSNRESLFNILSSAKFLREIDFDLKNCQILDLFSGSGAVSFEALSRGAKSTTLIDKSFEHITLSKKNAEILGEEANCQFITFDLTKPLNHLFDSDKIFDLIFIDPPYGQNLINKILGNLSQSNFLQKNITVGKNVIVVERTSKEEIDPQILGNFTLLGEKKYSKTIFTFLSLG